MNPYFSLSDNIFAITEQYPAVLEFLAANGFDNLRNEAMRTTLGKTLSLESALRSKRYDIALYEQRMADVIAHSQTERDTLRAPAHKAPGEVRLQGVLPCPIRVQLMEKLEGWRAAQKSDIVFDLQAASMGLDWIEEQVEASTSVTDLADLYLSAGFGLFFDRKHIGRYADEGGFANLTGMTKLNADFDNDQIDLKDPKGRYAIVGVVPAVFAVNKALLGDRPMPRKWSDLFDPAFENCMALPTSDLDLFHAVLLGIYRRYGADGVAALGRGMMRAMHPAQMIKEGARRAHEDTPLITVMPYFFTQMNAGADTVFVWPEDGAIVSPIFLLSRADSRDKTQPLIDFLSSKELGEVFCAGGKFPSTHPEVDNGLRPDQRFLWPGWDFLYQHDIGKLLPELEALFFGTPK